jgi:hypothetical protein
MAVKLITYDLNRPGQKYDELYEEIKALGTSWWHYLDSTWLVASSLSCDAIVDRLRKHMDSGDQCLVVDVSGDSKQGWLPQEAWDWINKYW